MPILFAAANGSEISQLLSEISTSLNFRDGDYSANAASPDNMVRGADSPQGFSLSHDEAVSGVAWYHFDLAMVLGTVSSGNMSRDDGYLFRVYDQSNEIIAEFDMLNGEFRAAAHGDSIVYGTDVFESTTSIRFTYDVKIVVTTGNVVMEIYRDSVLMSSATTTNTTASVGNPVRIDFDHVDTYSGFAAVTAYYSQMIITDNEATFGWKTKEMLIDADGDLTAWSGDYAAIADDDTATRISSTTADERSSFSLENPTIASTITSIRGVFQTGQAYTTTGSPTKLNMFLRIGSTNYDASSDITVGDVNLGMIQDWDENPATNLPWTSSDLDTLQIGVTSKA